MKTYKLVFAVWLLVPQCGCPFVSHYADGLARRTTGPASCLGKACDRGRWVVVTYMGNELHLDFPGDACDVSYRVAFASSVNALSCVSVRSGTNGLVASVTRDGVVHVAELGGAESLVDADLEAQCVQWSNQGDRLAVLTKGAEAVEQVLLLLSPELDELSRFDLGVSDASVLSWNANDSLIAVTAPGNAFVAPDCIVVAPDTGHMKHHVGVGCHFIGAEKIVGWNDALQAYAAMRIQSGQVVDAAPLLPQPTPPGVRAARPTEGLFITFQDPVFTLGPGFPTANLRTLDAGPARLPGVVGLPQVIPIETARPVLEAAGFSVDGPCVDQSGSAGG